MDEELVGELRQSAARDGRAYARLKAVTDAAPEAAEAADEREVVMVRMGSDGLPEQIFFAADWREYCPTDQLSGAVMDAVARATESITRAWADAVPGDEALAAAEAAPPAEPDPEPEPEPVRPSPNPRPLDELAESVITQLNAAVDANRNAGPQPVDVIGEDRSRRVRLTLSPAGMTNCQVDTGWARSQSAARLGQAFQQALRDGRRRMKDDAGPAEQEHEMKQADRALSDAMAYLTNRRLLGGG